MNSTLALLQLVGKSTITQGSWVKLEEFTAEQVTLPDVSMMADSLKARALIPKWTTKNSIRLSPGSSKT